MWVYLNGALVSAEEAKISVFDRGFLYGDGVFDSVPFFNGRLFRFEEHWNRFAGAFKDLQFVLPSECGEIRSAAEQLIQRNGFRNGMLRMQVSRGVGARGYSLKNIKNPTWI